MKITALEEYGLRCMMQLAFADSSSPVTVSLVAEREGLTTEYAGKLLNLLRQAGLVESVRGRNGGFVLAHTADEINLADIVRALSNDLFDTEYCERHSGAGEVCVHQGGCVLRPIWSTVSAIVAHTLESFSLMDLMQTEAQMHGQMQPHLESLPARIEQARSSEGPRPRLHQVEIPSGT